MAHQYGEGVRNAQLDQLETTIGASPKLYFRTGSPPANCASADTGSLLATLTLPADWMAAASGGSKAKANTWQGNASAGGTIGHFRIKDSGDTACHIQGTVGMSASDMIVDNNVVANGQQITVNTFTLTRGNA